MICLHELTLEVLGAAVLEEDQLRREADLVAAARRRLGYLHEMNAPRTNTKIAQLSLGENTKIAQGQEKWFCDLSNKQIEQYNC